MYLGRTMSALQMDGPKVSATAALALVQDRKIGEDGLTAFRSGARKLSEGL